MQRRNWRAAAGTAIGVAALACGPAGAGGISLHEVGTADIGLAAAGYAARAQDAATVFTNPAGMTRLASNQLTLGAQALYADLGFAIGAGTSPWGSAAATAAIRSGGFPEEASCSQSLSPDVKVGLAVTGNFGLAVEYDPGWAGRYYAQEGTLLGVSVLPSVAWRVSLSSSLGASLNLMYGIFDTKVAVNNLVGADGQLALSDNVWCSARTWACSTR